MSRSIADSKSFIVTAVLSLRAASSAASFTRFARSAPAKPVELVDEHDARRLGFGLLEEIADPCGADADEHLDEFRSAEAEEGDVRFARDGAREQRLAGAGRTDEQDAFRNAASEVGVLL